MRQRALTRGVAIVGAWHCTQKISVCCLTERKTLCIFVWYGPRPPKTRQKENNMRWDSIINWTQASTSCDNFNPHELVIERPWLKTWHFIASPIRQGDEWHDIQQRCESIGVQPYPSESPQVWPNQAAVDETIFPDLGVESTTPAYWIVMGRWWRPRDTYYVLGFSRECDSAIYDMAWP